MPFSEFPKPYTLRKDRQFYMSFAKFPIQPYIGLHRKHIARRPVARSLLAGFCSHHDIEIDVILNPCNKPCSNNLPKIVSICTLNCTKSRQILAKQYAIKYISITGISRQIKYMVNQSRNIFNRFVNNPCCRLPQPARPQRPIPQRRLFFLKGFVLGRGGGGLGFAVNLAVC